MSSQYRTLMVEPTGARTRRSDSDDDKDCQEVQDVLDGKISVEDSPLRHAPHTADVVAADDWDRKYSREIAAYPLPWVRDFKVWPSAARIDNTYGDRNLVCTCPPLEAYEDDEEN